MYKIWQLCNVLGFGLANQGVMKKDRAPGMESRM